MSVVKARLLRGVSLCCCIALLPGCGVLFGEEGIFRDRSDDYLKAETIPPLKVPAGVDREVFGQLYVIPQVDNAEYEYPEEFEVPRPQALSANVYTEKVKIQSLGEERWIAINSSPSEVWPRVRSFLSNNGLTVANTDPQAGIIETAWLNFKDDPDHRDKYRLRIEQGVQPESAEIHVLHIKMPREETPPAQVQWPELSEDKTREAWMVDELAASLARTAEAGSASLLAQTIGGASKVSVVSRNGEPVLRVDLERERAWATLTYALNQEGFRALGDDFDRGLVYAQYTNPDEREGFFSGWFSDDNEESADYTLDQVLDQMAAPDTPANRELLPSVAFSAQGDTEQPIPGYLFSMIDTDRGLVVAIRDTAGRSLPPRRARELLAIVRRNLI